MTNQTAVDFIKDREGFRANAYQDDAGIWTIGYGTTRYWHGERVIEGQKVNEEVAGLELIKHVNEIEKDIRDLLDGVKLNENQMAAMISFVYNLGLSSFASSTLLIRLHTKCFDKVAEELMRWVYITDPKTKNKIICEGLVNRRKLECELFLK